MSEFKLMLAPIEDMTSNAFRTICHKYGADITFTEMVRFESLAKNNKTSWDRIILKDKTPAVIQIIGHKEIFLKKFLSKFEPNQGFMGFNLNLGCPAPNFVNQGVGCAMVKRISKTRALVETIKKKGYNASIKIRLGLNQFEKDKKAYLRLIKNVNANSFIIHARHGNQSYNVPADFSIYQECVDTGKTIIANGDIKTQKQIDFLKKIGLKGAMIGRPAILDPSIFNKLKGLSSPKLEAILAEYVKLADKFDEPFRYRKNILKRRIIPAQEING